MVKILEYLKEYKGEISKYLREYDMRSRIKNGGWGVIGFPYLLTVAYIHEKTSYPDELSMLIVGAYFTAEGIAGAYRNEVCPIINYISNKVVPEDKTTLKS